MSRWRSQGGPGPPSSPPDPGLEGRADQLLAMASHAPSVPGSQQGQGQSLEDLLCRLHAQESIRDSRSSHLNLATNLLAKLTSSPGVNLSRLVVNLLPGDEGYTIALHTSSGAELELVKFSYEDRAVLESVDAEEIPVLIMDLICSLGEASDLYHGNSVVCEVRDCRRAGPARPRRHLTLLRPTTQSIICDSLLLSRPNKWSHEDRLNLESQLLLASGSPLCLDPSPVVSFVAGKVEHNRKKFSSLPLRRHAVKRYSQAGQNRKRKLESLSAPCELALHDFIRNKTAASSTTTAAQPTPGKRRLGAAETLKVHQDHVSARVKTAEMTDWRAGCLHLASPDTRLAVPAQVDVQRFVRPLPKKIETTDMTPQLDCEYILETAERGQSRIYHTKLTILKRPANDEYIGELYVERDYREEEKKGSTCRFELGTLTNATRYINQFTEIFTEEGRKNVKITHKVPNQPPRVSYTPGMRASMTQAAAANTSSSSGSPAPTPILQKKPAVVSVAQPPAQAASNGGGKTGTMTVSSPGLGQMALQIQQQSPQGPAGKMRGQQTAVQVVQQVNQAGQVVHQVLQAVPQSSSQPGLSPAPSLQTSMAPLTSLVPTSIASKLPTAPLARPDLPTSSTAGPVLTSASPQQNQSGGKPGENQQEAISAIVHSLMMAETQLKLEEQRKGPVLPTVPVPAASLAARVTVSSRIVVSRPGAGAGLPTYSQAISLSTSPSSLRRSSESPAQVSPSVESAGTLSALLADTPAADKPLAGSSLVSGNSLLERLVSGTAPGGLSASASASSSNLSPAASQLPSVQTGGGGGGVGGVQSNGGGEEITLQSLLSGPAKVQSPSKVSPLLQQLQQPVQSYPPSMTSPRHPPPSPRPLSSPRQVTPPSPNRTNPAMSALQQQLMQPPAPRYPGPGLAGGTTHSILSAQLTAPPRNTAQAGQPGQANGQNTVQLVSQSGQQVQLVNQVQPQVQLVNHHVNNVQLVNSPNQPAVLGGLQQVQLVNQVAGGGVAGGQQIMVNNLPMQLSLSHPVQFSVNLGESAPSSIATIANGATQTPILVSGAGQPGGVTVTSMANLGKLVSNGPNGAPTVLLQSQAGNILLPSGVKAGGVAGSGQTAVVRQGQVMVRQGQQSPVLVQLPSGHQQLVRQVSINPGGNLNCNIVNKSSPSTPSTPSPSVASPHQAEGGQGNILLANQKSGLVGQQMMTGALNQATLNNKIRGQRKQSLK